MKKGELVLPIIVTSILIIFLSAISFSPVFGAPTNFSFSVNLTITGNAAPTIIGVITGLEPTPTESANTTINIYFNASDDNGYADIDYTTAQVILYKNGEAERTSSSCEAYDNDTLTMSLNCTINLLYYDADGAWTINATVSDSSTSVENSSITLNYGQLKAVRSNIVGVTFGDVTLGQTANSTNDPIKLNNTGNQDFTEINITAYDLVGQTNDEQYIASTSLYVNATGDNIGDQLSNNTKVVITGATLPRASASAVSDINLTFFVEVPSSGLSNQDYISSSNWLIEVWP